MAINPNNALDARHRSICGATGAGKTVACKLIPDWRNKCVAIFDIYGDYRPSRRRKLSGLGGNKVHHYTTRATFAKAFIEAWSTGQPFYIAYQPKVTGENYRTEAIWFAQLMWEASDGNRELHIVWEELAKWVDSAGKETSVIGELATGGRKFGVINTYVYQRPAEIPKTLLTQCSEIILGAQQSMLDVRYWMRETDIPAPLLVALGEKNSKTTKHYIVKSNGIGNFTETSRSF